MKKVKNFNYLYILAILAILAILFIIIITMRMKESLIYKYKSYNDTNFIPTHIEKNDTTLEKYYVMYKWKKDYPGNDMSNMPITTTYTNCLDGCIIDKDNCVGIVTDFEQDTSNPNIETKTGKCWRKKKMNIGNYASNRYSTILNRDS